MMNIKNYNVVSIICGILLLIGILNLPISYYYFLRIIIFVSSLYITYELYNLKKNYWWIFLIIGLLFNPIWLVTLDKGTWQIVDIAAALLFFFFQPQKKEAYKLPKSRLAGLDLIAQMDEEQKILEEYGRLLENINKDLSYPAFVYPITLLPAQKEEIREALEGAIATVKEGSKNSEMINSLKFALSTLDNFIADEDAKKMNDELSILRSYSKSSNASDSKITNRKSKLKNK